MTSRTPSIRIGARIPAIAILLLAGLGLRWLIAFVMFPGEGLGSDLHLFGHWAQTLVDHGPGGFYENAGFADYPPGYLWVLWLLGLVGNGIAGVTGTPPSDVIGWLIKLPAIFADLAIAGLVYWAASRWRDQRAGLIAAALFLFIPVTWYDSALWGQVDAIGALLLLGSVLLLIDGWSEPAVAVAVLATLTKPQYAIGLVIIGAVLLRRHLLRMGSGPVPEPRGLVKRLDHRLGGWFTARQGPLRLVSCAVVAAVVGILAILPFDLPSQATGSMAGVPILGSISGLLSVVGAAAAYYNVLTANAFNAWALVGPHPLTASVGYDLFWTFDSLPVLFGIPAVTLGAALLLAITAVVAVTLLLRDDRTSILLAFTVLAVAFFAVPTRVHERYLFPAFVVGVLLAATSVRWRWWVLLLGLANVANLHAILTLPYAGYGTPAMQALPFGKFMRDPFVVGVIADLHTALFVVLLAAFLATVTWPALSRVPAGSRPALPRGVGTRLGVMWVGVRGRLASVGTTKARTSVPSRVPASEGAGRFYRPDLLILILLVLVTFGTRLYRLETPRSMYFDERWHATSGAEFLQDWRYGIPDTLSEWTHPHVAKYLIAAGLVAFGNDRVTAEGQLGVPVRQVAFEPTYADTSAAGALKGDRLFVATGSDVRVAWHGALDSLTSIPIVGATSVVVDPVSHWMVAGTDYGGLWVVTSDDLDASAALGSAVKPRQIATLEGPVEHVWVAGGGRVLVQTGDDRMAIVDVKSGTVVSKSVVAGIRDVLPLTINGRSVVLAGVPAGLIELDAATLEQIASVPIAGGVTGLELVDGSDQLRRERVMLPQPTIYVATGAARMNTFVLGVNGVLAPVGDFKMPGPVSAVRWDRPSDLIHVLGTTPTGKPTIYVIEPHGNAVFADTELPFTPAAWALDVQPNDPSSDRERALAFDASGAYASVDVGSHAFAWRLPGVLAGALMAGLLYLLARLLFRRPIVGLIFAGLLVMDGLLFQQSRIAMNDVYVGLFIVAAFTLLAWLLGRPGGRISLVFGPLVLGLTLGLALATKWVGAYAMGGVILIILLRSPWGRKIALAGMVVLTGVLGFQAIADDPPNTIFMLVMLALTGVLAAGIVRMDLRPPADGPAGPRWVDPRWRRGLPFVWMLACLMIVPLAVYVVSYVPWALSTAGGPQLFPGWPPGNTGQTFADLQVQMYRYHDEFRFPHGAGSPWWAWPFDLKPIWGYLETFADTTQAGVLGAANPVLLWLSVPAIGFGAWQAWRRRSLALGFVVVAYLALWIPWARIDRVAFNYHYYTALPFALMLLAYFLAELWDGASTRTWWLARVSVIAAVLAPTAMWLFKGPLCGVAGAGDQGVCATPLTDVAAPVFGWLVVAVVVGLLVWRMTVQRRLVIGILAAAAAVSLFLYPAVSAMALPNHWPWVYQGLLPTWDSSFLFYSNSKEPAGTPLLGLGALISVVLTAGLALVAVLLARAWGTDAWTAGSARVRGLVGRATAALPPAAAAALPQAAKSGSSTLASAPAASQAVAVPAMPRAAAGLARGARLRANGRIAGMSPKRTVLALTFVSLAAALVATRASGPDGPWLWNYDSPTINFPLAAWFHEALSHGSLPLWNDRIGFGFPLYADGQIGAFYPPNWLIYQLPPLQALDLSRIIHLVIAGLGAGLVVMRMTGSRLGAVTGSIVTVLCGGIVSKLAWTQALATFAWMPWIFLILLWRRPNPTRWQIAGAGALWGFQALAGHPPYWVLTGIAAGVIILSRAPSLRGVGMTIGFGVVGALVGAAQLVPTAILTTLSFRAEGLDPAVLFLFSATPFDFLGLAFANAFASATAPATNLTTSWYPPGGVWALTEMYAYIGLPALAMAAIGLTRRRARPLLVVSVVMVAIPIIGVFRPAIWAALPGLSGLRHPVRAYLVLDLALAIAAGFGVARLRHVRSVRLPAIAVGIAIVAYGLTAALILLTPDTFRSVVAAIWPAGTDVALIQRLASDAMAKSWPILFEIALGVLILVAIARWRWTQLAQIAAVALIAVPLVLLSPGFNQSLPATAFSFDGTALVATLRNQSPHRVLSLDVPFYGAYPDQLEGGVPDLYSFSALDLEASRKVLADLTANPAGSLTRAVGVDTIVSFGRSCPAGVEAAYNRQLDAHICRLDAVRPPYWMPAGAVTLPPATDGGPIHPIDVVVDPDAAVASPVSGSVGARDDSHALIFVPAPSQGYVFIDRAWWPGWQVTVDGVGVTPYRVWGGQLVPVTAGQHRIEQHFFPWDAAIGGAVSLGTLLAIAGVALVGRQRSRRSRSTAAVAFEAPPAAES